LLASFDRVVSSGRPELVLVSGYSGIGKSSVVHELNRVLVPPRGLFASGKFDQYKRDIPYSTLAQAFQGLIRSLLSKSEGELNKWRDALHDALGPNGKLIVNLVPELQLIIGEPPPVPDLPLQDAQRRFRLVFRRFIGVFARSEHPLALFLDDLQWLDSATLDLIEDLLTQSDVRHVMLIGAYRDNEVNSPHPLMRKLEAIRTAGAPVQEIVLAPLTREGLAQLTSDALHCEPKRASALAELIHEKTAGNPFFAIQFISALVEESLLTFDYGEGRWSWDLNRIRAKGYTDNVVDLMVGKLSRLPAETQQALRQLACLGNSAETATLSIVLGTSEEQVQNDLWPSVHHGLIERPADVYRFVHDRVQEAAYTLIPAGERAVEHLRSGRLLAAHTRPEAIAEDVSRRAGEATNHGGVLITSAEEREQAAELNLIAGQRARASTAYASALTYLAAGSTLLPDDAWERRYDLAFALELHRAECEFLTGDLGAAEHRLRLLATRAATLVDLAAVTSLQGDLFTTGGRSESAVEVCLDYLRHVGIRWSAHPTNEEVQREYERIWRQIGSRSIEELVDLPLLTDPKWHATMEILTVVLGPALFTDENLLCLAVCRMANLTLEHGNSDGSCVAYVTVGMLLGPRFGDYRTGFSFGKLGLDLVEKRGLRRFEGRVYAMFGSRVRPWTQPVRTGLGLVWRAFDVANRLGDLTYAGLSRNVLIIHLLFTGDPLGQVRREAEIGLDFARQLGFGYVRDCMRAALRLICTLRGLTPEFGSFNDAEFDEGDFEQHLAEGPRLSIAARAYWIRKLQARFFAGAYVSAVEAASHARSLILTPGSLELAEYELYSALARAALCDAAAAEGRAQHRDALAAHHRQLQEWAENCPANFADRAALVGAEIARIESRPLDAEQLYEQAIRSARVNGFVHNEALAYELAAGFYAARGLDEIAALYLRNARDGYRRWGADGKVRQLEQRHPNLRGNEPPPGARETIGAPIEHIELATILKLSHAVSGEIVWRSSSRRWCAAIEHAAARNVGLPGARGGNYRSGRKRASAHCVIVRPRNTQFHG
jgi:predicted ATPase